MRLVRSSHAPRGELDCYACGCDFFGHHRQLLLHGLLLAQRFAELDARIRIIRRQCEHMLHRALHLRGAGECCEEMQVLEADAERIRLERCAIDLQQLLRFAGVVVRASGSCTASGCVYIELRPAIWQ